MELAISPEYKVVANEIREEGREEGKAEAALMMRSYDIDPEAIERCTGFDENHLLQHAKEQKFLLEMQKLSQRALMTNDA